MAKKKKAAKKKAAKKKKTTRDMGTEGEDEPVDLPPVENFDDEERAFDPMRGREIRFDVEDTPIGFSFQGLLLGKFVNPKPIFKDKVSTGYNFCDLDGKKATLWGSAVLDRLMPQFEPFNTFITVVYMGASVGAKGNTTKIFDIKSSVKGFEKYKHLLDAFDQNEFEWFEEAPE